MAVTRKQQLVDAFRTAGQRGLTSGEMEVAVGRFWRLRLSELRDDGYVFLEHPSKTRAGQTFRWQLVSEPSLLDATAEDERLLQPPVSPPENAIYGGGGA